MLANTIVVGSIKRITNEERPNGGEHSFPSGHTSTAFVMATMLFHEFKDTKPALAYSGFAFATATGVLRVLNNAHWVSDVLVGAGIGIIITDLVYRFEPLKNWNPFKNKKVHAFISPSYLNNTFGLYANIQF
jgi:membrane-associated phospholipid phosphatase